MLSYWCMKCLRASDIVNNYFCVSFWKTLKCVNTVHIMLYKVYTYVLVFCSLLFLFMFTVTFASEKI